MRSTPTTLLQSTMQFLDLAFSRRKFPSLRCAFHHANPQEQLNWLPSFGFQEICKLALSSATATGPNSAPVLYHVVDTWKVLGNCKGSLPANVAKASKIFHKKTWDVDVNVLLLILGFECRFGQWGVVDSELVLCLSGSHQLGPKTQGCDQVVQESSVGN